MLIKSDTEWGTEQLKWFSLGANYGSSALLLTIFGKLLLRPDAEELLLACEGTAKELWSDVKEAFQEYPELKTLLLKNYPNHLLAFKKVYNLED